MSAAICVDASFIVGLVSDRNPACSPLWITWQSDNMQIVAPTLIYYEVSNAFHRLSLASQISFEQADHLIQIATNLEISLFGDPELHQRAISLAQKFNLSAAYDAHYLALSERLTAQYWTADRRLYNSVQATFSWINLVA